MDLQSVTMVSLPRKACGVEEQESLSYRLPHQALPLLWKELPLQLDPSCERAYDPIGKYFFVYAFCSLTF